MTSERDFDVRLTVMERSHARQRRALVAAWAGGLAIGMMLALFIPVARAQQRHTDEVQNYVSVRAVPVPMIESSTTGSRCSWRAGRMRLPSSHR